MNTFDIFDRSKFPLIHNGLYIVEQTELKVEGLVQPVEILQSIEVYTYIETCINAITNSYSDIEFHYFEDPAFLEITYRSVGDSGINFIQIMPFGRNNGNVRKYLRFRQYLEYSGLEDNFNTFLRTYDKLEDVP
jgi:hypothetical protein